MTQLQQLERLIKIQNLIADAKIKCLVIRAAEYYDVFGDEYKRSKDIKSAQEVVERIESYYNTKLMELYQSRLQELIPIELTINNN